MNILLAGGSGFIGSALAERLLREGHAVTLLTRDPARVAGRVPGLRAEAWDARTVGPWSARLAEADAVINLTGELLSAKRWSQAQKERLLRSRTESTAAIVAAIRQENRKPPLLLNASGVGYYGNVPSGDVPESFPAGDGFLANLCREWEEEAFRASASGVRVITLRLGVVLAPGGGALQKMLLPFRLFIGGPIGSGRQWFPWIHREDVIGAILFLLQTPGVSGPVNLVAPEAVNMKEFCRTLGSAMGRPSWAPVPAPVLRVALGEMAEMILTGQRAVPKKLTAAGFTYRFPTLRTALGEVLHT